MTEENNRCLPLSKILRIVDSLNEQDYGESVPFIDASPVREMQKKLLDYLYHNAENESHKIAAYVIYHIIENVFYNLSGDVLVNDDISKAQYDYLKKFTEKCERIRRSLQSHDTHAVNKELEEMIMGFFQTVKMIDKQ